MMVLTPDTHFRAVVADSLDELYPYTSLRRMLAQASVELQLLRCKSRAEVLEHCADAQAIIVHWLRFDRELISALPNCRVLIRYGIGYEVIDVDAATECGVLVCNTPFFCIDEVADHTMALLLSLARRLFPLVRNVTAGYWDRDESGELDRQTMHRLRGQTLGLIGFGKIGRAVAERARAFGLQILAYDPYVDFSSVGATCVAEATLEQVLACSDFVSVHVPLTSGTRQLLNSARLRLIKPTACLINLSRGAVIEETALIEALRDKRMAGAALDVLAQEPPAPDNPLLHMEHVIITPHYGAASAEAIEEQHREVAESVMALPRGQWPRYVVNKGVVPKQQLAPASDR